jgi:hypothetical protein
MKYIPELEQIILSESSNQKELLMWQRKAVK